MFGKSFKSVLAAVVVASTAALAPTTSANAGSNFGVYIGGGHSGVYIGNNHRAPRYRSGVRRGHNGICGPRRALNKAWRMGVNRPHVARVNGKKIVIAGFNRGHRAKVVFKRGSNHCRVLRTRGLR